MSVKTWVPLIVAIVLGLVAAKLGRDMMSGRSQSDGGPKLAPIVVVTNDITPGRELTAEDLTVSKIASDAGNVGFSDPKQLVGRVVLTELAKGQPVFDSVLAPTGSGSGLQALVPPGYRAVTVDVNEFTGVAGLLVPGCAVDVIATIQDGDGTMSRTIVENVRVTAVGQRTGSAVPEEAKPGELFKSVTLLTTPQEAEAVELACATGQPRLVLRSSRDDQPAGTAGITLAQLTGRSNANGGDPFTPVIEISAPPATRPTLTEATQGPEAPQEQPPVRITQRRSVTVIRGGVPSNVVFELRPPATTTGMMTEIDRGPATR